VALFCFSGRLLRRRCERFDYVMKKILLFLCLLPPLSETVSAELQMTAVLDPVTRQITVVAEGLESDHYEMRLLPATLNGVEMSEDVNEPGALYLPPPENAAEARRVDDAQNMFFFNDLVLADGWDLVVRFPRAPAGRWKLNGRFSAVGGTLGTKLSIPVRELEHGENLLHFQGRPPMPALHYRRSLPAGKSTNVLTVGHSDWTGEVRLVRASGSADEATVASVSLAGLIPARRVPREWPARWWEDQVGLSEAVLATGRNILQARIQRPDSMFSGGFNLVYDVSRKSHRMPHWIWSWGPSIRLLLELEKLEPARQTGLAPRFHAAALAAGRRSLEFGVTDPQHIAAGVSTVRWEPSHATPNGWAEYISTADSLFLAGWGWMSLYESTYEAVYLERTQTLVAAAERLMRQYPVVPQDWIVERNRWTQHTLDESVFGMVGFTRLYAASHSPEIAAAGRRFLDSHLQHMGRESGLLARAWMRDENKGIWEPDIKGHAWVIEGYLDAYRLSGEDSYLALARTLAAKVISCQADDGAWTYVFKKPERDDPRDDKAIAIWAYLFYDVYRITHDPAHLAAARRALGWCLRHQDRSDDPYLNGAILNSNAMAYVRRRPLTILYTTTFFGLALLEELALTSQDR
jgi:hypothetical protein